MPALLNATSTEPKASCAARKAAATSVSDVTSACTYSPLVSAAAYSPAASSMSTATTCAPSAANRRAAASPIPLPAPVMTTVLSSNLMVPPLARLRAAFEVPSSLVARRKLLAPQSRRDRGPLARSLLRRNEHVLGLGERVGGVRAQLTAEARLLEAAERRPVAHRGMRVHRQVPGLHRAGDPDRPAHVAGPDGAGQAVGRVVGDGHGLRLIGKRGHGHHRAEHFLGISRVVRAHRSEHRRRVPV